MRVTQKQKSEIEKIRYSLMQSGKFDCSNAANHAFESLRMVDRKIAGLPIAGSKKPLCYYLERLRLDFGKWERNV